MKKTIPLKLIPGAGGSSTSSAGCLRIEGSLLRLLVFLFLLPKQEKQDHIFAVLGMCLVVSVWTVVVVGGWIHGLWLESRLKN